MVIRDLDSASAVIDALGGTAATARLTGRRMQVVSNWRASGRLPPETFLIIRGELERQGFAASPLLWGIKPAGQLPGGGDP